MKLRQLNLLLVLITLFISVGCDLSTGSSTESVEESVDSVLIIVFLENNVDVIENTATVSHNGTVLYTFDEGKEYKVSVPESELVFRWETRHIPGSDRHPYVYWLERDGSGYADTTITEPVVPVSQNRYRMRGTKFIIDF